MDRKTLITAWSAVFVVAILLAAITVTFVSSPLSWIFLAVQIACMCVAVYFRYNLTKETR